MRRELVNGYPMPQLAAYRRGECSAQDAINRAQNLEEALAILRDVNYRRSGEIEDAEYYPA